MRIANGVYVLPIPRSPQEASTFLNLTLIVDETNGNTLIDAGLPDQSEEISAALVEAGIGVRDLSRIIFTHQDLDHIGSGAALVRQSAGEEQRRLLWKRRGAMWWRWCLKITATSSTPTESR